MSKEGTGMTLEELCARVPELNNYLKFMPQELNERYWIHTYPEGPSSIKRMSF